MRRSGLGAQAGVGADHRRRPRRITSALLGAMTGPVDRVAGSHARPSASVYARSSRVVTSGPPVWRGARPSAWADRDQPSYFRICAWLELFAWLQSVRKGQSAGWLAGGCSCGRAGARRPPGSAAQIHPERARRRRRPALAQPQAERESRRRRRTEGSSSSFKLSSLVGDRSDSCLSWGSSTVAAGQNGDHLYSL